MSIYRHMPNISISLDTVNVSKMLERKTFETETPLKEALPVHGKRNLNLNHTLRKFHLEVKKFKKRRLDSRQKRHNLRYRLTNYDDSVPLLSLDFLESRFKASTVGAI